MRKTEDSIKHEETIIVDLFAKMVNRVENTLNSNKGFLKNQIKYHGEAFNQSLQKDFDTIKHVLQTTIDKFYISYYEVNNFTPFTLKNFDYALESNLALISSAKKINQIHKLNSNSFHNSNLLRNRHKLTRTNEN